MHHSAELVLSRFEYYDKSEWTDQENELMQDFAQAYFIQCLTSYPLPQFGHIDSILIMLWKAQIDINQVLNKWTIVQTPESLLHFNDLIQWGFMNNKDTLSNAFGSVHLSKAITHWLESKATKQWFAAEIEKIILDPPTDIEPRTLEELSWTYERLKI